MYHSVNVQVKQGTALFQWCDYNAHCANNLYNAALFRERQMMTSSKKAIHELTDNELEVMSEVENAKQWMTRPREVPPSGVMSYTFLNDVMRFNCNPDYYAEGFPIHCAQNILKQVTQDLNSFFKAVKKWNVAPWKFNGKPKLPEYKHKQGATTFVSSNQECRIHHTKRGNYYCSLPKTKEIVHLGKSVPGKLIEVHISPMHGIYQISCVFDDEVETVQPSKKHERMVGVDPGVNNLLAVVNNCGLPNLLFNGRPLKSINQLYNKQIANIVSENTKGTTDKFKVTPHYQRVTMKRNNCVKDYILKTAKILIHWCVENRIDTIVLGKNADFKKESNMKDTGNQNFVQIPHATLYKTIAYMGERYGIHVMEQEESYTSQASFLSRDYIPAYGVDDYKAHFSGIRTYRGLYKDKISKRCINADFNGAANILRKCFPDAFQKDPDFNEYQIIKHPDLVLAQTGNFQA